MRIARRQRAYDLDLLPERLRSKVDFTGECWVWTRALNNGYGVLSIHFPDGRWVPRRAHRLVYELLVGPIPEGLQIDHLCRNRACCNPDHLEPVTHRENSNRGFGACGINSRKTHCQLGHPLSGDNLWIDSKGGRCCVACRYIGNLVGRRRTPCHGTLVRLSGAGLHHRKCTVCGLEWIVEVAPSEYLTERLGRPTNSVHWSRENEELQAAS